MCVLYVCKLIILRVDPKGVIGDSGSKLNFCFVIMLSKTVKSLQIYLNNFEAKLTRNLASKCLI